MASDFLYWQKILRDRAYHNFVTGPLPPDNQMEERFIKADSALEAFRFPFLKGESVLQALQERFVKGESALAAVREFYILGGTEFTTFQLFFKGETALAGLEELYIRGDTRFAYSAIYIKGGTALVKNAPLEDLGPTPPATKAGLISRQYLSLASVKKEVV